MAVVRITDSVINMVRNKVSALYANRVKELEKPPGADKWGDKLWDLAFGSIKDKLDALPESFIPRTDDFDFGGWYNDDDEKLSGTYTYIDYDYTDGTRPKPDVKYGSDAIRFGLYKNSYRYELNAKDPRWDEFKQEYIAWTKAKLALSNEVREATNRADLFLRRFATLAPALKEWPALWDLLPESVKEQHRKIIDRPKSKPQVQSVSAPAPDLSDITTQLALNKFDKANSQ